MINQSQCTIIIPHLGMTKEEEYAIDQCLISLKETAPDIRVMIAKNGPKCSHDNFDVWVKEQDQGMAVNAAVATTDTDWIMVSNSDMIYPPEWFEKLTGDVFSKINPDNDFGCISPKLIEPRSGAPTFEVFFAGGAGGDFNKKKWLNFVKEYYERKIFEIRTGFNLPFLIHRDLWNTIGGYDINYRPWGSNADSDLEYKIRLAGVQPYQNTNSIVYHFSNTTPTFSPDNRSFWEKNWHYFINKWGFERASVNEGIWEASFSIPTIEQGRIFRPSWENKYK